MGDEQRAEILCIAWNAWMSEGMEFYYYSNTLGRVYVKTIGLAYVKDDRAVVDVQDRAAMPLMSLSIKK